MRRGHGPRQSVEVLAPAKLNLVLSVGPKRDDGYHEVASVMVACDLYDRLQLTVEPASSSHVEVRAPGLSGGDTLVTSALWLVLEHYPGPLRVTVELEKAIPPGAGLGGGSSDAGAAMRGLEALAPAGLEDAALLELAARIGSDVPFFAAGAQPAVVSGRGERTIPLDVELPEQRFVIGWPGETLSTAVVYDAYEASQPVLDMDEAVRRALAGELYNDLTRAARACCPALDELYSDLEDLDVPLLLAGSGSAVACRVDSDEQAESIQARMNKHCGGHVWQVQTLPGVPEPILTTEPVHRRPDGLP